MSQIDNTMLPVGTMLHNRTYLIEKQLGSGGFGNTYKVKKMPFEETYAMKEFYLKDINVRIDSTVTVSIASKKETFESQKRKFTKEALRLHRINNDYIVHVEDFFECNGTAYYVMEYIDGESLSEMVKRSNAPLPESQVWHFLDQLLDALKTIHSENPPLTHLDIKPGNIMCDRKGNIRLIDFGASKQFSLDENIPMTLSTMCYTPRYAPMEQTDQTNKMIGPWTDFYALGATLYYVLTAHRPPSYTTLIDEGEHAFDFPVPVSEKMRQLIAWMMKPQRKQRPQSVDEIKRFLNSQTNSASDSTQFDDDKTSQISNRPGEQTIVNEQTNYQTSPAQNGEVTSYDNRGPVKQPKSTVVSGNGRGANNESNIASGNIEDSFIPKERPGILTAAIIILLGLACLIILPLFRTCA